MFIEFFGSHLSYAYAYQTAFICHSISLEFFLILDLSVYMMKVHTNKRRNRAILNITEDKWLLEVEKADYDYK